MTTFKDFVKSQALRDKLPFDTDFTIIKTEGEITENVAGFELARLDDLKSSEAWFFETLESLNSGKTSELQLLLRSLAKKLSNACGLETIKEGIEQLFDPKPELVESEAYQEFVDVNQTAIDRVVELFRLSQNNQALNWFRVTFFMLSRYDSDWTLGKTAALRNSQIAKIMEFITKEANGGVAPEPIEETESSEGEEGKPAAA